MKKLAVVLSVLVVIAAIAFVAIHHRTVKQHRNNEVRGSLVKPLSSAEQESMARAACGSGRFMRRSDGAYACAVCPPNSDSPGESASEQGGWVASGAKAGSFTATDQDEAVLHAVGCEAHANNYGGDFLLRRSGGVWTAVRYAQGAAADDKCQLVKMGDGRDALVCKDADMHQGIASEAVHLLQFEPDAPPRTEHQPWTPFLAVTDESSNCGFERSIAIKPHTIQAARIEGFEVLPENAEGRQDVIIQVTISRAEPPVKQTGTCPTGVPKLYRLTYHHTGDHFEAAEGYVALHAMDRPDCCQVKVEPRVVATRF